MVPTITFIDCPFFFFKVYWNFLVEIVDKLLRKWLDLVRNLTLFAFLYTEKTILPIPFTLSGIWSWWQFSFRFWNKWSSIWFKIEKKTVTTNISHSMQKEMEIWFSQCTEVLNGWNHHSILHFLECWDYFPTNFVSPRTQWTDLNQILRYLYKIEK